MASRLNSSRASISSQSGAAKAFEENIIRQTTDATWKSYGSFITKFNQVFESIHESNIGYINSVYYSPFTACVLSDAIIEDSSIYDLCSTCGNMELNKIILVFSKLALTMKELASVAKDKFIAPLVVYGCQMKNDPKVAAQDYDDNYGDANHDGNDFIQMSELISLLYQLHIYIEQCCEVGANLMKQLDSLFGANYRKISHPNKPNIDVDGVRFDIVLQSLASLAVTLVNLDEVISNQMALKKDFVSFKRMLQLVSSKEDLSSFGIPNGDSYKLKALYEVTTIIEKSVIDSFDDARTGNQTFFSRFLDACASGEHLSRNEIIADHLASFIRSSISDLDSAPNFGVQTPNFIDDQKWFSAICLFVIYVWSFHKDDRRLLKHILDSQKKLALNLASSSLIIHLNGNVEIFPEIFLASKLPSKMADKKILETISASRESLIKGAHYVPLFEKEYSAICNKINHWLIRFESDFGANSSESDSIVTTLSNQMKTLEEAYELTSSARKVIRSSIFLHLHFGKAISKAIIMSICSLINILKMIEIALERNKSRVLLFLSSFNQYNCCIALNSLSLMKKRLVGDVKKYSEKKLDIISGVILCCNCLHGPLSETRQVIVSLCLNLITPSMNESESGKILSAFRNIDSASKIIQRIKFGANTDYMFFNRNVILSVYFNQASPIVDIKYFFFSFNDWLRLLINGHNYHSNFGAKIEGLINDLESEIMKEFRENYLMKICSDFETELRLQSHRDLQLDDQSPFKRALIDFKPILSADPIRLFNKYVSICHHIESYLSEITYNLTTITLHDWKSYESMLSLARHRFYRHLSFISSQLPSETINQGLDILDITRNIHIFVTKYYYNLNNQLFIEKSSDSKHLNVLQIAHVSNSITTHGYGIINTAVNFSYQFLKKKFTIFSTILYQDNIKSRLIKDLRFFKENSLAGNSSLTGTNYKFSFEKAEKFVKGIRKMGLNQVNESILDQFKSLITEIGNVLAFIRILRSGALHSASSAVNFVPDLDDFGASDHLFSDLVTQEGVSDEIVIQSAANLDTILSTLNRNFSDATDYFQLLISVFASALRDVKNVHLRNFHVMIPALTISHVEALIVAKEKMLRSKTKITAAPTDGVSFTDDGFAVGVAYILSLLDQVDDFDSFQWFSSVDDKINADRQVALAAQQSSASDSSTMNQTTGLTLKRLDALQKEFNLLNYNLISCKVLFRAN